MSASEKLSWEINAVEARVAPPRAADCVVAACPPHHLPRKNHAINRTQIYTRALHAVIRLYIGIGLEVHGTVMWVAQSRTG